MVIFVYFVFCSWPAIASVSHSVMSNSLPPHPLGARQAPLSMEFSRQEYRSGLPFPSPGDLPDPGREPGPPALQADCSVSEPSEKPIINHHKALFN